MAAQHTGYRRIEYAAIKGSEQNEIRIPPALVTTPADKPPGKQPPIKPPGPGNPPVDPPKPGEPPVKPPGPGNPPIDPPKPGKPPVKPPSPETPPNEPPPIRALPEPLKPYQHRNTD